MKRLVIIRHAKSSWSNALLEDYDRPLNDRGRKDAVTMAKRLKEKKIKPDLIISSPAKRAMSTCKRFIKTLDLNPKILKKEPRFYLASESILIKIIKEIDDKHNTVFIFGHNPGLTLLVNYTSNLEIDNIPTTGMVVLELTNWKKFGREKANAVFFDYPKK